MDNNAQKTSIGVTNRGGITVDTGSAQKPYANPAPVSNGAINPSPNQAPVSTSVPVGGPKGKEREPRPAPFPDVVKMSESEINKEEVEIGRELESIVEKSPQHEKPQIPDEAAEAGMEHVGEDKDIPLVQAGPGKLPMTYEEASFIRKKNRFHWKNSIAWLAAIIQYHWKRVAFGNRKKKIEK